MLTDDGQHLCTGSLFRFLRRHALILAAFRQSVDQLKGRGPLPRPDRLELAQLQSENFCIRSVDNFLSFVSEIIQLAMRRRPELLRSQETITLEDVMNYSTFPNLVSNLIDRTLNKLAYKSIEDVEKFIRDRANIELVHDDTERSLLTIAIELRNIYTHNRGNISEVTLKRLFKLEHNLSLRRDQQFEATFDELVSLVANLVVIAKRLDGAFAAKFGIRRKRYRTFAET